MLRLRECSARLRANERGISSADLLSGAVSNEMTEAAGLFADDGCGNRGGGDGTGGDGGSGQGSDNTC